MKFLFLLLISSTAFSSTCDHYKKIIDKNISPSTDKTCKSIEYYYGLNDKKGYEEAKKCAYRELQDGDESVFGGVSILMMVYANGRGAGRDLDLALKYACLFGGSEAELKERMKHLESLRKMPDIFEVCDDVTSGLMEGHCASLFTLKDKEHRTKRLQQIQSTFGVDSQAAFKKLKEAFDNFQKARLENEVDLSGSARGRFLVEAEEKIQSQFFNKIENFEKNGAARLTADNEQYLNSTFQFLMTKEPLGTIKPEGIRLTQTVWLRFRNAWLAFAKVRYPKVSQEGLLSELNDDRIKELEEVRSNYQ